MKVKDFLYKCDSLVKVAVIELNAKLYTLKPDYVGMQLNSNHWILNEEIAQINVKDNVIVLSVEVE